MSLRLNSFSLFSKNLTKSLHKIENSDNLLKTVRFFLPIICHTCRAIKSPGGTAIKPWCLVIVTSYSFVWNKIRTYSVSGIIENEHFLINIFFMESSFLVKLTNRPFNQINICFSIMPDFAIIGGWVVNF